MTQPIVTKSSLYSLYVYTVQHTHIIRYSPNNIELLRLVTLDLVVSSILGAFALSRKAPFYFVISVWKSFCPSLCPSSLMHQHCSHWTVFRKIWHWRLSWNPIEKIKIFLTDTKMARTSRECCVCYRCRPNKFSINMLLIKTPHIFIVASDP